MVKNIFKIALSVFLLGFVFLNFQVKESYAQALFNVEFDSSNTGTSWGVRHWYYYTGAGGGVMGPNTTYTNGTFQYFFGSASMINTNLDHIKWLTACVDPNSDVSAASAVYDNSIATYTLPPIDAGCHSMGYNGTPNSVYAGCGTNYNSGFGSVAPGAQCPTNTIYCTAGGTTAYPTTCNTGGGCSCSGTSCVCPPPAPPTGLNATPWCNLSASRMTFGWNVSSGATYYNLTWNNPTGSYNNMSSSSVCSGSTCSFSPAVDFTDGVLINWSIAACNSSGCSTPATGAKTSLNCSGTKYACVSGSCQVSSTGTFTESTCGGTCAPPTTCDTCSSKGYNCGSFTNNCGQTLSCGTCSSALDTCTNNVCVSATTCFYCDSNGACNVNYLPAGSTCSTNCNSCSSSCTSSYNLNASGPNYTANSSPFQASGFLLVSTAGKVGFNLTNTCSAVNIKSVSAPFSSPGPLLANCAPLPSYTTLCQVNGNNAPNGSYNATVTTVDTSSGRSLPLQVRVVYPQQLLTCYQPVVLDPPFTWRASWGPVMYVAWQQPFPVQYYDTTTGTTQTVNANQYCTYVDSIQATCKYYQDITNNDYVAVLSAPANGIHTFQVYGSYFDITKGTFPASTFAEAQDVNVTVDPITGAVTCTASTYSVSGNAYVDTNGNGVQDVGEPSYTTGTGVSLSTGANTTSNSSGNYSFSSLNTGSYTVTLTVPSGYKATTTNPVTTSVGPSMTVNFGIQLIPTYSVSGNVFVDDNKNKLKDAGESNYTNGITITSTGGTVTYPSAGSFNVSLQAGTYTLSYTSLPTGYQVTYPLNGPPPSFSVTVGSGCSVGGSNSANCDANGNIANLNFGITNSIPWIQAQSGDITGNEISDPNGGGLTDPVASGATCGGVTNYASLTGGGGTPGIINAGAGSYSFCPPNVCQNLSSPTQWIVGGLSDPYTYDPATPGIIKTSYSYISSIASQSTITPTSLGTTQCGAGGIANCQLSPTLTHGIYIANGDLTLTGPSYTFPSNQNYVILVKGKLFIKTQIHVPVGSTAFFTASDDIHVDKSVGEADITSTNPDVEGYYSTDKSFFVDGNNSCPTVDLRLNMAGAVVVNAALGGGSFTYTRDLCGGNLSCPVFYISERPDFVLNSPFLIMDPRRVWQEIAP